MQECPTGDFANCFSFACTRNGHWKSSGRDVHLPDQRIARR